ncbi:hypothetical protein H6P81_007763 [Aristolochia fimbriata]|uniref:Uncharacterized protein n=1 Tax=Aristolochia fimbriata TaxID=158543 RepID=A0AAV7F1T4_ARIFI|nr:hypothetical protein H6P81_007763 [Aristolochia fimbriata]
MGEGTAGRHLHLTIGEAPTGYPHQRSVPRPQHQFHHEQQHCHQRLQQPGRALPPHLERHPTQEEFMDGRNARHQLPHPPRRKLHLPLPGEGPDRKLLLLSLHRNAPRRRRLRRPQSEQPPPHPRPLPRSRGRLHRSHRRLVQQGPQDPAAHLRHGSHPGASPNGVLINGESHRAGEADDGSRKPLFTMKPDKVYNYRICNVGLRNPLNFRIQDHPLKLVEMDGSHTVQNVYESLDIHVGQCFSVLVTANQPVKRYYMVASSRFTKYDLSAVALIAYEAAPAEAPSAELPPSPVGWAWSLNQFRSFRWNLTASAARPNPQGSYHYGGIEITRTIKIANTAGTVDGKLRYAVNGVSFVHPSDSTPLKLAEYYGVADKVFKYDVIGDEPPATDDRNNIKLDVVVINGTFRNFVEIVFENHEKGVQSWHVDGYSFFAVGMDVGKWSPKSRKNYNLLDAVSRHTIQVYPKSWSAILLTLDNAGMWNVRSNAWERHYLGQQFYISVVSPARSLRDEYSLPDISLRCGIIKDLPTPPPYTI